MDGQTHPLVSVLIPVHNAGAFLTATVNSVLAQTWRNLELILVDDGSSDNCTASVAAIADPRIKLIRQERQGAPTALNTGVRESRGDFIAFLDHDDLWLPRKLESHIACYSAYPDADLTFDWTRIIDRNGDDIGLPLRVWHGTISFEQLIEDFVVGNTSAIVVRRKALEEAGHLNCRLPRVYDIDLCLRMAARRPDNCRSVPERLTLYRRHPDQMSRDWRKLRSEWESLLSIVPGYAPRPVDRLLPAADSNMHRYFAWIACEQGDFPSAVRLSLSAFRRAPRKALLDSRNWLILAAAAGGSVLPRRAYRKLTEAGKAMLRCV